MPNVEFPKVRAILPFAAGLSLLLSEPVLAQEDGPPFLHVPVSGGEAPQSAAIFNLKLQLVNGSGLVQSLLDTGVTTDDAQLAGRLAASALKDKSGCSVTVSLSRALGSNELRLDRVVLVTTASQTVLERREGELRIADQGPPDAQAVIV